MFGYAVSFSAAAIAAYSLVCPNEAYSAALEYMNLGAVRVLPSLIVYMICSRIIVRSAVITDICSHLGLLRRLFGVSPSGLTVVFIGLLFGYPMGAVAASELYKNGQIDKKEVRRLMPFCNNAGASFLIGAVGTGIFGSLSVGIVLFIGQTLSSLTLLILTRKNTYENTKNVMPPIEFSDIADAISKSGASSVSIIVFIAFFGTASKIIADIFHLNNFGYVLVGGILEISGGISCAAKLSFSVTARIFICGAFCGFGGLSVAMQAAYALLGCGFDFKSYFSGRLCHGLICGTYSVISYILLFKKSFILSDVFKLIQLYIIRYSTVFSIIVITAFATISALALTSHGKKRKKYEKRVENKERLVYNRDK